MPGKRVYAKSVSRVRIPLSPLNLKFSQNFSFFSQKFFS